MYVNDVMHANYYRTGSNGKQVLNPAVNSPTYYSYIYGGFKSNGGKYVRTNTSAPICPTDINHLNRNKRHRLFSILSHNVIDGVWFLDGYFKNLKQTGLHYDLFRLNVVLLEFINLGGAVVIKNRIVYKTMKTKKYTNWKDLLYHLIYK